VIAALFLFAAAPLPSLQLWHSYRGGELEALTAIAREESEQLGVAVELTQVPFDNLQNKLLQALSAGQGPDLFIAPHERASDWERYLFRVTPLGDLLAAQAAVQLGGETIGFPFSVKTLALLRRHSLLPDRVATLDHLRAANPTGYGLGFDTASFYFASPLFFAREPALFDGAHLTVAEPRAEDAFAWIRAATRTPHFVPRGVDHAQLVAMFRRGDIAALVDGPWVLSDLADTSDVAVQTLPPFGQGWQPRPFLTVDAIFLPRTGASAARALAEAMASPAHCAERVHVGHQLPPFHACADTLSGEDARLLRPFFEQAEHAVPMPVGPEMAAAWDPLKHLMSGVVMTDEPLQSLAEAAVREHAALLSPERRAPWWLTLVVAVAAAAWLWRRLRRKSRASEPRNLTAIAFVAPAAAFALPLLFLPLAVGCALSLFSHHAGRFDFVGLGNFLALLSSARFYSTLGVTVLWTVASLAMHLTIGIALAVALNQRGLRLRGFFRVLLIVPWAIPNYISALIFKTLFNFQLGAINQLLRALHLQPIDWFARFTTSFAANLIANAWLGFPFIMVVTLGALQSIPESLREAMALDGASPWQSFRHLTLPTIAPIIAPAVILGAIWTFNMFNVIYLVSGGEPRGATEILISEAYRWAFERGARYGYAAAYCVAIFGILALLMSRRSVRT
jgi:arabinogalactan oligomer/maltooligosaccharide transport system permease protein